MLSKTVLLLLHIDTLIRATYSLNDISVYTSHVVSCTSTVFRNKSILELHKNSRGKIDCMVGCAKDVRCVLAVYQEFEGQPSSCSRLSDNSDSPSALLDMFASSKCVAMFINPCLNGGHLYRDVCLCQNGFAGETCERIIPRVCDIAWVKVVEKTMKGSAILYPEIESQFGMTNPKVLFKDQGLNVLNFMKATKANRDGKTDWYFVTYQFFEKIAWNKFANTPQRKMMMILFNGDYETLSFNGSEYTSQTNTMEFSFIAPGKTRFEITRKMPKDFMMMREDLANGFSMFRGTWIKEDTKNEAIVVQFADRHMNTFVGGLFVKPPRVLNFKFAMGKSTFMCASIIGSGQINERQTSESREYNYMNPCWTRMTDSKYNGKASALGWKMLGTYLRLGHDVRVKVGSISHTVLEVIQMGDSFNFVLAPYLSQDGTTEFVLPVYGVRSVVSSFAIYHSCQHQIEGEKIIRLSFMKSEYNVIWFVDTRKWNKVLVVASNSSVLHGSVDNLIAEVKKGCDVRIWIIWPSSGRSRFLDTHMSSVTGDGKVSTESLVTWKTTQDASVALSPLCDLEYILVTSEGRVEILSFNVWTFAISEVQSDVVVTWFVA